MPHLKMTWEVAPGITVPNASVFVRGADVDTIAGTFVCALDPQDSAGNSLDPGISVSMPMSVYQQLALASRPAVLQALQTFAPATYNGKLLDFSKAVFANGALTMSWPWTSATNVNVTVQITMVHIDNTQQLLVCYLSPLDSNGMPVVAQQVGISMPLSVYTSYVGAQNTPLLTAVQALPAGVYSGKTLDFTQAQIITP